MRTWKAEWTELEQPPTPRELKDRLVLRAADLKVEEREEGVDYRFYPPAVSRQRPIYDEFHVAELEPAAKSSDSARHPPHKTCPERGFT